MRSLTTNLQLTPTCRHDIIDVTDELERAVKDSGVTDGCIVAFCAHTTATLVLGEWEDGLLEDFRKQEGPAFLVITADVGVAQVLAEDAMFFKDRKVVERGHLRDILRNPKDEETRRMIEASLPASL